MAEQQFYINGVWNDFGDHHCMVLPAGVILGFRWIKDGVPVVSAVLPDKYIGDGNDLACAILRVLADREWRNHPMSRTHSLIEYIRDLDPHRHD